MSNKGDTSESNPPKGNIAPEKTTIKAEKIPSTSDKDAKTRIITARNRQTQSGPLVAGVVLTHSKSERTRNLERFHRYLYIIYACIYISVITFMKVYLIRSFLNRSENESAQAVDKSQHQVRRAPSFSGPLNLPNRASGNSLSAPIKPTGGVLFISHFADY